MLDINSLKLKDEDLPFNFLEHTAGTQRVADAQLVKALKGIYEWLVEEAKLREESYLRVGGSRGHIATLETVACTLAEVMAVNAAGIARPEGV